MDNSNQENIRSYWRNELTETERQSFEQKCVDDESFANSVAQFMQLKQIATETEKDRLKSLYNDNKRINQRNRLILITVLFLAIAFVFRMFLFSNNAAKDNITPVSEGNIFAMLVEENQEANRGDNDLNDNVYRKWFEAEKYDTLLFELEAVNLTNVVNIDELIWAAQSLYIQSKNAEMVDLIDDYLENNVDDISRKDELLWLQTLAYLKINDNVKAKSNLEEILNEYRLYQEEAKSLLSRLYSE